MKTIRSEIIKRDKVCYLCKRIESLEVHHITFRSDGGDNSYKNLITLCYVCHQLNHKRLSSKSLVKAFLAYTDNFNEPKEWSKLRQKEERYDKVRTFRMSEEVWNLLKDEKPRGVSWNLFITKLVENYYKKKR